MPKFIAPDGIEYKTKIEYYMTIFPRKEGESSSSYLSRYMYYNNAEYRARNNAKARQKNKERYYEDAEYRKKKIEEAKKRFKRTYVHKNGPHQKITCNCCCTCYLNPISSILIN